MRAVNPRIVYGSISGFGQDGPYGQRAGVDQIAQGMGGLMSITGLPGQGPVRVGIPIDDLIAGTLLALGISMALIERERTGQGRWVQTILLEAQIFMLDFQAARWLIAGEVPGQAGNDHPTGIPDRRVSDQRRPHQHRRQRDTQWERLCDALGARRLEGQARVADPERPQQRPRRDQCRDRRRSPRRSPPSTGSICSKKPASRAGRSTPIDQIFADPQVQHLGMARTMHHTTARRWDMRVVASPLNFSGLSRDIRLPTPEAGDHTDEVLHSVGYSDAEIAAMREKGVV